MGDFGEAQQRSNEVGRSAQRSKTLLRVKCRRWDDTANDITVRNLSATGLLGSYRETTIFAVGELVSLSFRTLKPIAASVAWCEDGQVGFVFADSIDVERLLHKYAQTMLPEQSPRSETMRDWIDQARRERENSQALDLG